MNEPGDPWEAELSALRPREVSPALRRRIAADLVGTPPGRWQRRWLAILAGGLAAGAACLAAVLFHGEGGSGAGPRPRSAPIVASPRPTPWPVVEESRPVLLAYQRALARSPEALAALLDQHARAAAGWGRGLQQVRGYPRSDTALETLLGDD
jgi:hypothetical protein